MKPPSWRFPRIRPAATSVAVALFAAVVAGPASAQQEFALEGALACLKCHESEKIMGILETAHANFDNPDTPASTEEQCEACHGPSATHMQFPMQVGNIHFSAESKAPNAEQNKTCLACHGTREQHEDWSAGPHGFDSTSCADCHSLHKARDPALSASQQTARCTESCHVEIVKSAPANSPHPFGGGENGSILCTACHSPHGPSDFSACLACHPQGPADLARQLDRTRGYHQRAQQRSIPCTSCHKGVAHALPEHIRSLSQEP